jgi:hypothetical protein
MVLVTGFGLKVTLRGGLDERADSGDGGLERRGVSSDTGMDASAMATGEGWLIDGQTVKRSIGQWANGSKLSVG